jgi:alpha-glucosidase
VYYDHRTTGTHGVFLLNSNGMDIKLNQTAGGGDTLEYNVIGGVLDFYFLAGSESEPVEVAKQYAELSGYAAEVPYWSFGFHQCRFGYKSTYCPPTSLSSLTDILFACLDFVEVANVITSYAKSQIPLETMWTDIDYMRDRLIFTVDPQYFPLARMREIVSYLHSHDQHYIVMTDPAVGYTPTSPVPYPSFDRGESLGVWLKNSNGSNHLGVVWPGVTVYPDWFHPRIGEWWNDEFRRFYSPQEGLDIDGVWIDMNEPASFCEYPCVDPFGQAVLQNMPPQRATLPPDPNAQIFVEGADAGVDNADDVGERAYVESQYEYLPARELEKRQDGAEDDPLLNPPYAIDNTVGALSSRTAYVRLSPLSPLSSVD